MKKKANAELSAHLARIEGQFKAARRAFEADDCAKVARTLLAASRSLSSLRAACVGEFLENKVYQNSPIRDEALLKDVRALIKA